MKFILWRIFYITESFFYLNWLNWLNWLLLDSIKSLLSPCRCSCFRQTSETARNEGREVACIPEKCRGIFNKSSVIHPFRSSGHVLLLLHSCPTGTRGWSRDLHSSLVLSPTWASLSHPLCFRAEGVPYKFFIESISTGVAYRNKLTNVPALFILAQCH